MNKLKVTLVFLVLVLIVSNIFILPYAFNFEWGDIYYSFLIKVGLKNPPTGGINELKISEVEESPFKFTNFSEGIPEPITQEELLEEYKENLKNPNWVKEQSTVCDGDYCFIPEPRKGEESHEYFKSLNLEGDELYAIMLFEISEENRGYGASPTQEEILKDQRITIIRPIGNSRLAKVPLSFLEKGPRYSLVDRLLGRKENFDFIRWIGIFTPERKIEDSVKVLINEDPDPIIEIVVSSYENLDQKQVNELRSFSQGKFNGRDRIYSMNIYTKDLTEISKLMFIQKMEGEFKPTLD
jgi:hypothetical protein